MDWAIQFYYDKDLDPIFINKLFYFLISKGVKYNNVTPGSYSIIPHYGEGKNISHSEKVVDESTEKLAEIVEAYLKYNLKTTTLNVFLDYHNKIGFYVSIIPEDNGKCLITFDTTSYNFPEEKIFIDWINNNLPEILRDRFGSANHIDELEIRLQNEDPIIVNIGANGLCLG